MNNEITYWYAVDLDPNTNEWLSKHLAAACNAVPEESLFDAYNKEHQGYEIKWPVVALLLKSKSKFDFTFKIYRRQGKAGKLYPADFLGKKRKKFLIKRGNKTITI